MRKYIVYGLFVLISTLSLLQCRDKPNVEYLNIEDDTAQYVGMEACKTCHAPIYESFMQTGMGQSWGLANKAKSLADFNPQKAHVYDTALDLHYIPYLLDDIIHIKEFRLAGKDTVHMRIEKMDYVVGSGQHTNSHLFASNGYLHQAPITYYTQKGQWDLAPGFEKGLNSRFERKIEPECITCHNGYPEHIAGSLNKYTQVKLGIDCERCHGPGSIHVNEKMKGTIVDTSKSPDYSIVNPKRLTTEQQNNLCQRCHLQGITVLNDQKTFFDFKPSQKLSQTMNVFMPNYSGSEQHMIMASHVERMKMSACFTESSKLSCINCHNPHVSVKYTPQEQYITACKNCHNKPNSCTSDKISYDKSQGNCIKCHMPKNTSIDIPHVAVTDHYIRRSTITSTQKEETIRFINMICYNNDKTDFLTRARAFLEFYERYEPSNVFLDSAANHLQSHGLNQQQYHKDIIRLLFLRGMFDAIILIAQNTSLDKIYDSWTAYRIGESFMKKDRNKEAIPFLKKAVSLSPFDLDIHTKLGQAYLAIGDLSSASGTFEFVLNEYPKNQIATAQLGYIQMQKNKWHDAEKLLKQSILLNPDHTQSLINLAVVYYQLNQWKKVKQMLLRAQKLNPDNSQIIAMLQEIEGK